MPWEKMLTYHANLIDTRLTWGRTLIKMEIRLWKLHGGCWKISTVRFSRSRLNSPREVLPRHQERLGSPFVRLSSLGWWPLIRMSSRSDTRWSPRDTLLPYRRIRGRVTTSDAIYGPNSSGERRERDASRWEHAYASNTRKSVLVARSLIGRVIGRILKAPKRSWDLGIPSERICTRCQSAIRT